MTCDPDLVADPSITPDPAGAGKILYWRCCERSWYLSPTTLSERERTYEAWHFAANALDA